MGSLASNHDIAPEIVELSGTPREIGLEHGRRLAPKIHSQIGVYTAMFAQTSKLDWPAVRQIATEYRSTIQKLTPDLYTEIKGIADGADVDVLDIVALNARSEIALGLFEDGCTSVGLKMGSGEGKGEGEGEVWLCQNWDWSARVKRNLAFMSIEQVGKPKIWMITEAGIVGKIGFNSSSVGVSLNAIRAKPTDSSKLPIHLALRVYLESTSASAAMKKLESLGGIAGACHILMADATGPTGLELSPLGNVSLPPNDDGMICHTNHFLANKFVDGKPYLTGSPIRLERANSLTTELLHTKKDKEGITAKELREKVFSDNFNAPQAIACQEDPSRPIESRSSTLFNIIMRFKEGEKPWAEVVWGRPGSGEEGPVLKMPW